MFTDNASDSPQTVALTGVGIAPVSLSPSSLNFGSVTVGHASAVKSVTLTNHQHVALNFTSMVASGNFAVTSNTCGASIAAGATCAVGITFSPTGVGLIPGTLTISYAAYGSPSIVKFTGTGNLDGLTAISVSPSRKSIALGTSYRFSATGTFANGGTLDITNFVTWASSSPVVATVNQGLAMSKGLGTTTITARRGPTSGNAKLTVSAATLNSMVVIPLLPSVPLGTQLSFSAIGVFSDESQQDLTEFVQWNSENPAVAAIKSGAGLLPYYDLATALAPGTTTIGATLGMVAGNTTLTVTPATCATLTVSPANSEVPVGASVPFSAGCTFTDGSMVDVTQEAVWGSSDGNVANIGNTGVANATGLGTTTIGAMFESQMASATLTVATCVNLGVSPADPIIAAETTQQFDAICTFDDSNTGVVTNGVQWGSSASGVGTVSNIGLASAGDTPGSTTITASCCLITPGSAELTVTNATLVSISITPTKPNILLGGGQAFTAIGTFSDGSTEPLTDLADWSITNSSPVPPYTTVATLSGNAATGVGLGTATITATFLSMTSNPATLTVIADVANCPAPTAVGLYTFCNDAYNDVNSGTTASVSVSPFPGNGVEVFAQYCANSVCNAAPTQTATIGDNVNPTEACFTEAPHSPYALANTSVHDYETLYAWYCPSIPAGVTTFTLTTSSAASYLQLDVIEWKAGSIASSNYFESVDQIVTSGGTPGTTATVPTSGSTVNANDLITATIATCGAAIPGVVGVGYTGIVVNPSVTPGHITEAKAVSSAGTQIATTTWSTGSAPGSCTLNAGGSNDTWFGIIVPLIGANQSFPTLP